ncbi:MAG: thioesterase family protein [Acidimicrobiales bacterium]
MNDTQRRRRTRRCSTRRWAPTAPPSPSCSRCCSSTASARAGSAPARRTTGPGRSSVASSSPRPRRRWPYRGAWSAGALDARLLPAARRSGAAPRHRGGGHPRRPRLPAPPGRGQPGRQGGAAAAGRLRGAPGRRRLPGAGGGGRGRPGGFTDYIGWTLDGSRTPDHPWGEESRPVALRYEGAPPPEVGQRIERPLRIWCRLHDRVDSDDPILHAALLAWISDKTLADLTVLVHGYRWMDPGVSSLSLDHAMWYAGRVRADGWLLFEQEVLQTASQRGLVQGAFVSPTGQRLATARQEALVGLPDAAG